MFLTAKVIYVNLTGPRSGSDTQIPPPPGGDRMTHPIPPVIHIDAIPQMKRNGARMEWWAHIRPMGTKFEDIAAKGVAENGHCPENIVNMDLTSDVPEAEVSLAPCPTD